MLNTGNDLNELLNDDQFIQWVLAQDAEAGDYWNQWVGQDPARKQLVEEAKEIILSVYKHEKLASKITDKELTAEAWAGINKAVSPPHNSFSKFSNWYKYAAAAVLLAAIGIVYFTTTHTTTTRGNIETPLQGLVMNNINSSEIELTNTGTSERIISLADGSRITLSPNSSIHYARLFNADKREIYLDGNAFFEVAKDASRPFYVYSGNVVTKVLGTSFRIIAEEKSGNVTVAVKTGKVTVFRQVAGASRANSDQYILTPNEQVVFNNEKNKPVKEGINDSSLLINNAPAPESFVFEETSLNTILEKLAFTYAVDIQWDKTKNAKCLITASLDGETLYNKLDFLCKVTGASYRIENYKVYIDSKGCD
jgi:transmembrane sensor